MDVATTEADVIEAWRLSGLFPVNASVPLGRPVVVEAQGLAEEIAQKKAAAVPINEKGITSIDQIPERVREGREQRRRRHKHTTTPTTLVAKVPSPPASAPTTALSITAPDPRASSEKQRVGTLQAPTTPASTALVTAPTAPHVCATPRLPDAAPPTAVSAAAAPCMLAPVISSAPALIIARFTVAGAKRANPQPEICEEPPRSIRHT